MRTRPASEMTAANALPPLLDSALHHPVKTGSILHANDPSSQPLSWRNVQDSAFQPSVCCKTEPIHVMISLLFASKVRTKTYKIKSISSHQTRSYRTKKLLHFGSDNCWPCADIKTGFFIFNITNSSQSPEPKNWVKY